MKPLKKKSIMVESREGFRNKEKKEFVRLDISLKFLIKPHLLFGKGKLSFPELFQRKWQKVGNSGSLPPSTDSNGD